MNATPANLSPKLLTNIAPHLRVPHVSSAHRDTKPECFFTIEEVQLRAETITPCLKKMLDNKPHWHWGINE